MVPGSQHDVGEHLPLTPAVLYILLALSGSKKHGYAIMQEVEKITEGSMVMGPGTLYGTIKRLLKGSMIVEVDERPDPALDDSRRRYYQLTQLGRKVLTAEAERLAHVVTVARQRDLLTAASHGADQ